MLSMLPERISASRTRFFMAALFYMLRLRRPFPLAILSLGSVAVIYFLFAELLNVIMPRGRIW